MPGDAGHPVSAPPSPGPHLQHGDPSSSPRLSALRPRSPFFRSPRGFARLHAAHTSDSPPRGTDAEKNAHASPPSGNHAATAPHHHRLALSLWGGRPEDGQPEAAGAGVRSPRSSGKAGEELDSTTAAQISSIRSALDGPSQIVRVVDTETGEVYELHLKRSDPYAVPAQRKESPHPVALAPTSPPSGSGAASPRAFSRAGTPKVKPPASSTPQLHSVAGTRGPDSSPDTHQVTGRSSPASPSPHSSMPLSPSRGNGISDNDRMMNWPSLQNPSPTPPYPSTTPRLKKFSRAVPRPKSRNYSRSRAENSEHDRDADDESIASRGAAARSMVTDLRSVEAAQAEDELAFQRLSLFPSPPENTSSPDLRQTTQEAQSAPPVPTSQMEPYSSDGSVSQARAMKRVASASSLQKSSEAVLTPAPNGPAKQNTSLPSHTSKASDKHSPPNVETNNRPTPERLYTAPEEPLSQDLNSQGAQMNGSAPHASTDPIFAPPRALAHPVARHGGLVLRKPSLGRTELPSRTNSGWISQSGETAYSTASESEPDNGTPREETVSDSPPQSALGLSEMAETTGYPRRPGSWSSGLGLEGGSRQASSSYTGPTPTATAPSQSTHLTPQKHFPDVSPPRTQNCDSDPEANISGQFTKTGNGQDIEDVFAPQTGPPTQKPSERELPDTNASQGDLPAISPQHAEGEGSGVLTATTSAGTHTTTPDTHGATVLLPKEKGSMPPTTHLQSHGDHSLSHSRGNRKISVNSIGAVGETILSPSPASNIAGPTGEGTSRPRQAPRGSSARSNTTTTTNGRSAVPQTKTRPTLPTICTGDAAFDQEANKNAERLRRQRRAKADNEEKTVQSPISPGGLVTPVQSIGSPTEAPSALRRAWSPSQSADRRILTPPQVTVDPPSSPLAHQLQAVESPLPSAQFGATLQHPSVGKIIDESHANYVLMYNMLTGIRIGVSRCQAKPKRTLTQADYNARHKFTFDIVGNELAPSKSNYDFKFKDYAPMVFRDLRELFHLDAGDYLLSLTSQYILSELGSPGKSGSFFYFSGDYRFIIKTIRHSEHLFLLRILEAYHDHVSKNPHTLLSRFYGLHRVKLPHGRKIHFVIMNNLFPPHRDIHETYDLKGSLVGREYSESKAAQKKGATLKDINWLRRARHIELGPEKHKLFEAQLKSDVGLLQRLKIMDYSLLIGLHDLRKGNSENLRQEKLTLFQPRPLSPTDDPLSPVVTWPANSNPLKRGEDATALRQAVQRSDPRSFDHADRQLPDKDGRERLYCVFYREEGGFRSTSSPNNQPGDWIYYMGVIDLFTPYTLTKRVEHVAKSIYLHDRSWISPVRPSVYGKRFLSYMKTISATPPVSWPSWRRHADPPARPEDVKYTSQIEEQVRAEGRPPYGSDKG